MNSNHDAGHGTDHTMHDAGSPDPGSLADESVGDSAGGDAELGRALGAAIDDHVRSAHVPPPVASIEARAAARAKARQVRRMTGSVAASLALIFGGVVAYNATQDDGETTTAVAEHDLDDAAGTPRVDAAAGGLSDATTGSDSDPTDPDGATVADPGSAGPGQEAPAPSDLSTGPTLDWREVQSLQDAVSVDATGDGRVYARSFDGNRPELLVTDDGVTWEPLPTPGLSGIDLVDLSGDRWVVTGWDDSGGGALLWSDDGGDTWETLATDFGDLEPLDSPYLTSSEFVAAVAASNGRILVVTQTFVDFDLASLLVDMGVVAREQDLLGYGWGSGTIEAEVDDPVLPRQVIVTYEEAGLDAETVELLEQGDRGAVRFYVSDGLSLDFVAEFQGAGPQAVASDEGFAVSLFGNDERVLVTSPDGISWIETTVSSLGEITAGPDGTLWEAAWDDDELAVRRSTDGGRTFDTLASFPGLAPAAPVFVGEAGVATTAYSSRDVMPAGGPSDGLEMLDGLVLERDGYELRYNEPEGGISLWNAETGEVVLVFPDVEGSDAPPDGVTEIDDGDGFRLIFEDPETGEPLVTFTEEDFMVLEEFLAGATDRASEASPGDGGFEEAVSLALPDLWIGWSADGTDWGWQTVEEAFSLGSSDAWIQVAVGDGFIVARVEDVAAPEADPEPLGDPGVTDAAWFVATVG